MLRHGTNSMAHMTLPVMSKIAHYRVERLAYVFAKSERHIILKI